MSRMILTSPAYSFLQVLITNIHFEPSNPWFVSRRLPFCLCTTVPSAMMYSYSSLSCLFQGKSWQVCENKSWKLVLLVLKGSTLKEIKAFLLSFFSVIWSGNLLSEYKAMANVNIHFMISLNWSCKFIMSWCMQWDSWIAMETQYSDNEFWVSMLRNIPVLDTECILGKVLFLDSLWDQFLYHLQYPAWNQAERYSILVTAKSKISLNNAECS